MGAHGFSNLVWQREGLVMTTLSTASSGWTLHPRQRTRKRSPVVQLALSSARALLVAVIVGQLGVALISVLRNQTDKLQKDLASTTELVPR
jgi:hypothetical protein